MIGLSKYPTRAPGTREVLEHPVAALESACRCRDRSERIRPAPPTQSNGESGTDTLSWPSEAPFTQQDLEHIEVGDHLGLMADEQLTDSDWLVPLVRDGLQGGERVLVLSGPAPVERLLALFQSSGIEEEPFVRGGQLTVTPAPNLFMRDGDFDATVALAFVEAEIEVAHAVGYRALRIISDMGWALEQVRDHRRLHQYEEHLHRIVAGRPCLAICRYHDQPIRTNGNGAATNPVLSCHARWLGADGVTPHLNGIHSPGGASWLTDPLPFPVPHDPLLDMRSRSSAPRRSTGLEKRNP